MANRRRHSDAHSILSRKRKRKAEACEREVERPTSSFEAKGDTMRIVAVDPGLTGAAAAVEQIGGTVVLLSVIDIPVAGEGAKRRLDAPTFARWLADHAPTHAYVEHGRAMPRQGVSSMFRYGRV